MKRLTPELANILKLRAAARRGDVDWLENLGVRIFFAKRQGDCEEGGYQLVAVYQLQTIV